MCILLYTAHKGLINRKKQINSPTLYTLNATESDGVKIISDIKLLQKEFELNTPFSFSVLTNFRIQQIVDLPKNIATFAYFRKLFLFF